MRALHKSLDTMKESTISVPTGTMQAIKDLLYVKEGGVDLSNILNDLSMGRENLLLSINLALAFKGKTPKLDQTVRYSPGYQCFYSYKNPVYSLILNRVQYDKHCWKRNDEGEWECQGVCDTDPMPYEDWTHLSTDVNEVRSKIRGLD